MLPLLTAVGLLQLGTLNGAVAPRQDFIDWRGRPVQPLSGAAMMRYACPTMPDSTAIALRHEATLNDFLTDHGGTPPADSLVTLACLRIRIGTTAETPRRSRFLMDRDEGWLEGALHAALAQASATPADLPTLRALAYSAVGESFDRIVADRFEPLRPLITIAVARLSVAVDAGVTDPLAMMSCVQLALVLERSAAAFRCALAGAATPGDRSWYLTRMAWLLAEARQGEAAKAILRAAAHESRSPADRAEVAYVIVDADDGGKASLEPAWMESRLAALAPMSANDLRAFLLRLQPLGWEWARDRRPAPRPAECRSERAAPRDRLDLQLARLWRPASLEPVVIAIGRNRGTGSLLFRGLGVEGSAAPQHAEITLAGGVAVVWRSSIDADPRELAAWSFRPSGAASDLPAAFGALLPDSLSGSGTALSDLVLTPADYELSHDDAADGFVLNAAPDGAEASILNLYFQTRSSTDVAGARLDITITGCKSNLYQDRVHVTSDFAVPAGLREVRRAIGLKGLAAGEYQLRLVLKSSSGEVLASRERAFRVG